MREINDKLDEILARAEAGKWTVSKCVDGDWWLVANNRSFAWCGGSEISTENEESARLIAAAHNSDTDVPALVKALRRSCQIIGEMSNAYCGLNDMIGRDALADIATILNAAPATGAVPAGNVTLAQRAPHQESDQPSAS